MTKQLWKRSWDWITDLLTGIFLHRLFSAPLSHHGQCCSLCCQRNTEVVAQGDNAAPPSPPPNAESNFRAAVTRLLTALSDWTWPSCGASTCTFTQLIQQTIPWSLKVTVYHTQTVLVLLLKQRSSEGFHLWRAWVKSSLIILCRFTAKGVSSHLQEDSGVNQSPIFP